ncbi:MAG: GNAT family N-acetyltransferase, partial [Solirubrobacterales bacterium]|nr:GNAT family N-acetyltransferase [Solirubrobacterales bacterium]
MPPLPLPDPELRDDAVRLRAPSPDDLPAMVAACQDPLIQRFTFVPVPYGEEDARAFLLGREAAREAGEALALAISPVDGDELLGMVGVQRFAWEHRTCDVGYWVAPAARGRGVAVRALRLLAPWVLRETGVRRIALAADVENRASQRLAERAGFVREGTVRSAIEVKGRRWTEALYSLVTEDLGAGEGPAEAAGVAEPARPGA